MKPGIPAWSVVVVVANGNNDVLAIRRGFNPRDPALPGGDSEPQDESPAQSAARELFEETGVTAIEMRCIDQWTGERGQPVFAFFVPKWRGKRLRTSDEGKPFWAQPHTLMGKTASYRDEAKRIFLKISETRMDKTG